VGVGIFGRGDATSIFSIRPGNFTDDSVLRR